MTRSPVSSSVPSSAPTRFEKRLRLGRVLNRLARMVIVLVLIWDWRAGPEGISRGWSLVALVALGGCNILEWSLRPSDSFQTTGIWLRAFHWVRRTLARA